MTPSILSSPIKLHALREVTCQSCSLRTLCLPLALNLQDMGSLDAIIQRGRPLKKGEHLFRQGDKLDALYALRSGCVRTNSVTDDGNEQITGFYLPGELVGLSGIDSDYYPISAVAIETTSVCEIPYARFDELTNSIPDLKRQLIHSMSKEMRSDMNMMLLLSQKNAEQRVASFILDLATRIRRRGYAADFIYLAMSRGDIANYLGLAVETASRVFTRLQKAGVISVNGRAIEVNDIQQLAHAAGTCLFADEQECSIEQQGTH